MSCRGGTPPLTPIVVKVRTSPKIDPVYAPGHRNAVVFFLLFTDAMFGLAFENQKIGPLLSQSIQPILMTLSGYFVNLRYELIVTLC